MVSLFADDRTLGVQEDTTRKLLLLINPFSEVAGFKMNPQKSVTVLYTKDKHAEKRTWGNILVTTATKGLNTWK